MLRKFALSTHRRRKLSPHSFDGTAKETGIVKVLLVETVVSELVGFGLQDFSKSLDMVAKRSVLLARNNAHAASRALPI
jgi:hypothetical protein